MTELEPWAGSPRSRALAWGLAAVTAVVFAAYFLVAFRHDRTTAFHDLPDAVTQVLFFVGLGTAISLRQPANPIGWLLTAGGLTWMVDGVASGLVTYPLSAGRSLTATERLAATLSQNIWVVGVVCSVGLPLLLFPAGRTRSRRWRWVLRAMIAGCAFTLLGSIASTHPVVSPVDPARTLQNPWGVESLATPSFILRHIGVPLLMATMLAAVVGIVARFRSATGTERQQLRWVRAGAVLAVVGMLIVFIGHGYLGVPSAVSNVAVSLGLASLPVTFTVAILRYRLYDLDRLVSRTVSYAVVSGLLIATYVGLVTAVSRLTPSSSSLGVAASTLAVAALFQPVRRRVQHAVDRRFNRARIDAEHIVEVFSRQLREQVDLNVVRAELVAVARQAVQPVSAALWLRGAS